MILKYAIRKFCRDTNGATLFICIFCCSALYKAEAIVTQKIQTEWYPTFSYKPFGSRVGAVCCAYNQHWLRTYYKRGIFFIILRNDLTKLTRVYVNNMGCLWSKKYTNLWVNISLSVSSTWRELISQERKRDHTFSRYMAFCYWKNQNIARNLR